MLAQRIRELSRKPSTPQVRDGAGSLASRPRIYTKKLKLKTQKLKLKSAVIKYEINAYKAKGREDR